MSIFYEIKPLDTLFFRGTTPMKAGQYNAVSMFPPPVSVIKGAFWTGYCIKNGLDFEKNLKEGKIPFEIEGILIKKDEKFYVPAPATWYYDSEHKINCGADCEGKSLLIAKENEILKDFNAMSSAGNVVFVCPKEDAKVLNGCWINLEFIRSPKEQFGKLDVLTPVDIYRKENRTGVGLTKDKQADDGKLYSSTHIRLNDGVSIVIAFSDDAPDFGEGKLFLGGEKRISAFKQISDFPVMPKDGNVYLSLVPIEATEENLNLLVSSGKLIMTAGWDLKRRFHKPSVNWIPAGAVFSKNINNTCLSLAEK